jgi:hypothetical protein
MAKLETIAKTERMASRDSLLGLVMDGKVFKHVAKLYDKRTRARIPTPQRRSSSDIRTVVERVESQQHRPHTSPDTPIQSAQSQSSMREESKNVHSINNGPADTMEYDYDESHLSTNSPDETHSASSEILDESIKSEMMHEDLPKPPIAARWPEIISFTNQHGEAYSALALTKTMIWQPNTVLRCETKLDGYGKSMQKVANDQVMVDKIIREINQQLSDKEDTSYDGEDVFGQLENAGMIASGIDMERQMLKNKIQRVTHEMGLPQRQFFKDWKRILEDYNLLEPIPDNSDEKLQSEHDQVHVEARKQKTPTPSEAARHAN